jgi:hypothetical protein
MSEKHASGAKQAAEKLGVSGEIGEKHPSGAKAHAHFAALTARLKSCPDAYGSSDKSFSAACKARVDSIGFMPGINPRPTARQEFFRSL